MHSHIGGDVTPRYVIQTHPLKVASQFSLAYSYSSLLIMQWVVLSVPVNISIFFTMAQPPLVGQGPINIEVSLSPSDAPHWLGILWMIDQPDPVTST